MENNHSHFGAAAGEKRLWMLRVNWTIGIRYCSKYSRNDNWSVIGIDKRKAIWVIDGEVVVLWVTNMKAIHRKETDN